MKKRQVPVHGMNQSETLLRKLTAMPAQEAYLAMQTTELGLTAEEAQERIEKYGENKIVLNRTNTRLRRLAEAFINPFNLVLITIACVTIFTDVVSSVKPDYLTVFIILFLILVSSMVSFFQSEKSNAAAEALSHMIVNKAGVLRDGVIQECSMEEIVPGDIVRLSAGDMIPADIRFMTTKDMFVAQAALTGESAPVEKFANRIEDGQVALTDISNIGFLGANVISGSAIGLVLATGNATYFGSMAKSLNGDRAKNSFERGVDSVSKLLIHMMFIMVPIVFLVNGVTKQDWGSALLFAITIAVGLTPEMLPVIMSSTLAKGAISMSKHQVIVKSLGAIQTFGEMDILCTDKTGTLTEDHIIIEKYMDLEGNDDTRVLRHAYLNSYFQTGLKNLLDLAVINRAHEKEMDQLLTEYTRIDEIPFDFTRRRMSVVIEDKEKKRQLITKGAVEEIMAVCKYAELEGQIVELSENYVQDALKTYHRYNAEGLRILAVAQKNEVPDIETFSIADESDMVLIGFLGFLDPPKESAKAAIQALKEYGVRTVVLTGDSEGVAKKVCEKVGIDTFHSLTGADVAMLDDEALALEIKHCNLFSKLTPSQKERVVRLFQNQGHTVGYMGDGINDAPPLHQADVGISVDTAVDIAKETADIILLKKDLLVLHEGVLEGRKTFGNISKYIKMAASGNFGNMFSVLIASAFLPFLPMLPIHILTQNLLCDLAQISIPFDHVDSDYLLHPRRWEARSIRRFMMVMGPLSSIFDTLCFLVLWFVLKANSQELAALFQSGWFVFGTISQVLVIHMIRTSKIPFIQSHPAAPLFLSTIVVAIVASSIAFTDFAIGFDMMKLPLHYVPWLCGLVACYWLAVQGLKHVYIKKYGDWL